MNQTEIGAADGRVRFTLLYHVPRGNQQRSLASSLLTMVFKLGIEAQKRWRRLNGAALLEKVVTGVQFVDGEELQQQAA